MFRFLPAALLATLLAACSSSTGQVDAQPEAQAPLVSVLELKAGSITVWDELPGRVSALKTAEVRAQVSGLTVGKLFEDGSEVTKGQPLFAIDASTYEADVASAKATLQKTRAVLDQAAAEFERAQTLRASNNISDQAFDLASSQQAQASADLAQAEAALKKAELSLSLATVRAPLDGRIGAATVGERDPGGSHQHDQPCNHSADRPRPYRHPPAGVAPRASARTRPQRRLQGARHDPYRNSRL